MRISSQTNISFLKLWAVSFKYLILNVQTRKLLLLKVTNTKYITNNFTSIWLYVCSIKRPFRDVCTVNIWKKKWYFLCYIILIIVNRVWFALFINSRSCITSKVLVINVIITNIHSATKNQNLGSRKTTIM
jgi:hypothetical protein